MHLVRMDDWEDRGRPVDIASFDWSDAGMLLKA